MIEPSAAALAYLKFVLERLTVSPSSLAKSIGVSATTLTRPLNDPEHRFTISMTTIGKIAQYSGINPGPFFETADIAQRHTDVIKGFDDHRRKNDFDGPGTANMLQKFTPIVGEIGNVGEISMNEVADPFRYGSVRILHLAHRYEDIFGVAVTGNGASLVANPGEFLICLKCSKVDTYRHGTNVYILQELDNTNNYLYLAAYILNLSNNGWDWHLQLASHERHSDDIIDLKELEEKGNPAKVIGVVEYVVREPTPIKKMQ